MGKGGSKTRLPAGLDALSLIQAQGARISGPARNEVFQQLQDILTTGGVGAKVPIIEEAVRRQRAATEAEVAATGRQFSEAGVTGPFAARGMAETRRRGEAAAAALPTQIAQQFVSQAPALAQIGYPGAAASGSATTTTPDTLTPAVGAATTVVSAVIGAIAI